ncbi:MAG: membrane protein insertion efficiency factor YidD [Chlamydiota bacterium]|nr:membrane protein insertion efficiency factor YidD [Chlamydiota bacterium]
MSRLVIWIIRGYQRIISPFLLPSCRFEPSCSNYMIECVLRHGLLRGILQGLKRILRCHPFAKGGYDPVR